MHEQDLLAAADVGERHDYLAVEAPGAQERRVEDVGPVRRSDDDNAGRSLESVHLDQQLIERLLALVVAAAQARAALAAHRVDLVDEHDARGVLLRLVEHVAHPRRADADEHLDEIGTGDGEERHFRFAGDRARKQRLPRAGVAHHQHALRDASAELLELGGIAQEIDQFRDFLFRFFAAGNVGEGDGVVRFIDHPRARFPERKRAAPPAALHLAHEEDPHADQEQHREPGDEDVHEERGFFLGLRLDLDAVLEQVGDEPDVARRVAGDALAVVGGRLQHPALDQHLGDSPGLHFLDELRILHRRLGHLARIELVEHRHQHQADDQPDHHVLEKIIQRLSFALNDCVRSFYA